MKKYLTTILVFTLVASTCFCQTIDDEMYEQANRYYEAKEYDKAIPILNELATRDHAKALNMLGVCYETGRGVTKDLSKCFDYFQKSANLGWRRAQCNLGLCYEYGKGVTVNKEKAYSWYDKSFRQYKELADNGDADAQLEVGIFYYNGRMRGGKDYLKSIPWFEKSANQGNSDANNYLGLIYQYACGVEKDVDKAYDFFIKGAEKGNCYAQRNLAWLFQDEKFREIHTSGEGDSYHQDFDFDRQTEKWLRMAAQNNADYMYELARFYLDMQVSDDWQDKDSYSYLRKAAEAGSATAKACLGFDFMTEKRYDEAFNLLLSAKEDGVSSFTPFEYNVDEDKDIDACLMILQYLNNNPQLKLDYYNRNNNDNYLLYISKGDENVCLVELSKAGSVISKTPYFRHIYLFRGNEINPIPSITFETFYDSERREVYFLNKQIRLDIMEGIYRLSQNNQALNIQSVHYNGGEYIYITVSNDKKQYGYVKINKAGKIIKSIPFVEDKIYAICDEEKINLAWDKDIYFIDSKINLDIVFTVFDFLFSDKDYGLDRWEALFVNNRYLLVHVQKSGKWNKWFKLSPSGTILGKTTTETDNEIRYYSSDEKYFYYYDHKAERSINLSLQEMLKRIK